MPRLARLDAPGILHHVIIRGIERRRIFRDSKDQDDFLGRLGDLIPETRTSCYAWALLTNHAHLLLRTGESPLSTLMRRLLTGYAGRFNRRHKRYGPLFQNRFKSIVCQEDAYLKELVRYIHLNPLRAKIVKDLNELKSYLYCGHSALLGTVTNDWQDTDYVLNIFGTSLSAARRAYGDFVAKGVAKGRRSDLVGGGLLRSVGGWFELKEFRDSGIRVKGDERILGSSDFVEAVLKQSNEDLQEKYRLAATGPNFETLLRKVARYYRIDPDDLKTAGKESTLTKARTVLCYLAVRKLQISCADVARKLKISPATVSRAASRGKSVPNLKQIQKELIGS